MRLVVKNSIKVHFTVLAFIMIGIIIAAVAFLMKQQQVGAATGGPTFSVVGTHPQASTQSTAWGRTIDDLMVDGTTLYAGYGDYNINTGPIHINPFDLTSNTFIGSVLSVPTEQIMVLRKINGAVYAPMTDPRAGWTSNVGFATNQSGTWANRNNAPAIHVFDVATLDGNDLWQVGSAVESDGTTPIGATAHRSTDGGLTWSIVQADQSTPAPTAAGFERYYWIAELNGKIYMQAESVSPAAPVRIFDGTTWSSGTTDRVCGVTDPGLVEVFNDHIICGSGGVLRLFDGIAVTTQSVYSIVGSIRDFYVADDGFMYMLGTTGIARSSDGRNWVQIAISPADASSIAVYNDRIYLGTANSQIMVSSTTITDAPPIVLDPPVVTTVSPNRILNNMGGTVYIYGTGFHNPTAYIGGVEVPITGSSSSFIAVTVPPRDYLGMADVVVMNDDGQSVTVANAVEFYELPRPVIERIEIEPQSNGTKHLIVYGKNLISDPDWGYGDGLYTSLVSLNGIEVPFCTEGTSFTSADLVDMGYDARYFSDHPPCYQLFTFDGGTDITQVFSTGRAVIVLQDDFGIASGSIMITNAMSGASNLFSFGAGDASGHAIPDAPRTGIGLNVSAALIVIMIVLAATSVRVLVPRQN